MATKLKITEQQLGVIKKVIITETNSNVILKNRIQKFLEDDYEPIGGVTKIANEYSNTGLIKKKIDGTLITPLALMEYMQHKFVGVDDKILRDSIEAWYYDEFDKETGMRRKK